MSVSQCAQHPYYQFVLLGFNPVLCKSTFLRPKHITCGKIKMTVVCAVFPHYSGLNILWDARKARTWTHQNPGRKSIINCSSAGVRFGKFHHVSFIYAGMKITLKWRGGFRIWHYFSRQIIIIIIILKKSALLILNGVSVTVIFLIKLSAVVDSLFPPLVVSGTWDSFFLQ